jgi:hypothetical protein
MLKNHTVTRWDSVAKAYSCLVANFYIDRPLRQKLTAIIIRSAPSLVLHITLGEWVGEISLDFTHHSYG